MISPSLLAGLLPPNVNYAEDFSTPYSLGSAVDKDIVVPRPLIFPTEWSAIQRAVPTRREEFMAGRRCARKALGYRGMPPVSIGVGANGEPLWPQQIVGSITHTQGYVAAAVAGRMDIRGIGIDAEPHEPLPKGILGVVAREEEQEMLRQLLHDEPTVHWDRLLFSAKESIYKAIFPVAGRLLDFTDVSVDLNWNARTFRARGVKIGPIESQLIDPQRTYGRFTAQKNYIATTFWVPGE